MIVAASQVKWNKIQTSVIATSHDGDLKLWDIRKSSTPFMYMSAHIGRIFSLDWSPQCQDSLVTSSQDCYVKFFNVNSQPSNGKNITNYFSILTTDLGSLIGNLNCGCAKVWKFSNFPAIDFT